MPKRGKQFFYPGQTSWPVIGLARGEGAGVRPANTLFGVALSGSEVSPVVSGPHIPTTADWAAIRASGFKYVRWAWAWENLQKTLNGSLDATNLAAVQTGLTRAAAQGIDVWLDLHNQGCYVAQAQWTTTITYAGNAGTIATGVNALGDGTLTAAHLADFWTKFMTACPRASYSALKRVGPMNEMSTACKSVNLQSRPNYPKAETGGFWYSTGSSLSAIQAVGTNPLGVSYGPKWSIDAGGGFGGWNNGFTFAAATYSYSAYLQAPSATISVQLGVGVSLGGGAYSAGLTATTTAKRFVFKRTTLAAQTDTAIQINAASGSCYVSNTQLELTPAQSTSSSITGAVLTVGGTVTGTFAVGHEIVVANVAVATISSLGTGVGGAGTYNLSLSPGNVSGVQIDTVKPYEPNYVVTLLQPSITAIRALDATIPIMVNGAEDGRASAWDKANFELYPLLSANTNIMPEAHLYPDGPQGLGGGGAFSGSFASYTITNTTGAECAAPFIARAAAQGFTGVIGEFGIPGSDANWLATQGNMLTALRAANMGGTVWQWCTNLGADGVGPLDIADAYTTDPRVLQIAAA